MITTKTAATEYKKQYLRTLKIRAGSLGKKIKTQGTICTAVSQLRLEGSPNPVTVQWAWT